MPHRATSLVKSNDRYSRGNIYGSGSMSHSNNTYREGNNFNIHGNQTNCSIGNTSNERNITSTAIVNTGRGSSFTLHHKRGHGGGGGGGGGHNDSPPQSKPNKKKIIKSTGSVVDIRFSKTDIQDKR